MLAGSVQYKVSILRAFGRLSLNPFKKHMIVSRPLVCLEQNPMYFQAFRDFVAVHELVHVRHGLESPVLPVPSSPKFAITKAEQELEAVSVGVKFNRAALLPGYAVSLFTYPYAEHEKIEDIRSAHTEHDEPYRLNRCLARELRNTILFDVFRNPTIQAGRHVLRSIGAKLNAI